MKPIMYDPFPSVLEIIIIIAKKIWQVNKKKKSNYYGKNKENDPQILGQSQ